MKKLTLTIAFALAAFVSNAQVELKTNPFGMALGAYNVTAEFQLENKPSLTILGSAWYNTQDFQDWMWTSRDGGLSAGVRQYFNKFEDQGVFLGLATRYIPNTYMDWWDGSETSDDYASLGFTGGYKYIYNDKITIDVFIGMGRIVWEEIDDSWGPAEFISGLNFGYRF